MGQAVSSCGSVYLSLIFLVFGVYDLTWAEPLEPIRFLRHLISEKIQEREGFLRDSISEKERIEFRAQIEILRWLEKEIRDLR